MLVKIKEEIYGPNDYDEGGSVIINYDTPDYVDVREVYFNDVDELEYYLNSFNLKWEYYDDLIFGQSSRGEGYNLTDYTLYVYDDNGNLLSPSVIFSVKTKKGNSKMRRNFRAERERVSSDAWEFASIASILRGYGINVQVTDKGFYLPRDQGLAYVVWSGDGFSIGTTSSIFGEERAMIFYEELGNILNAFKELRERGFGNYIVAVY